jgi:hypothetical protein
MVFSKTNQKLFTFIIAAHILWGDGAHGSEATSSSSSAIEDSTPLKMPRRLLYFPDRSLIHQFIAVGKAEHLSGTTIENVRFEEGRFMRVYSVRKPLVKNNPDFCIGICGILEVKRKGKLTPVPVFLRSEDMDTYCSGQRVRFSPRELFTFKRRDRNPVIVTDEDKNDENIYIDMINNDPCDDIHSAAEMNAYLKGRFTYYSDQNPEDHCYGFQEKISETNDDLLDSQRPGLFLYHKFTPYKEVQFSISFRAMNGEVYHYKSEIFSRALLNMRSSYMDLLLKPTDGEGNIIDEQSYLEYPVGLSGYTVDLSSDNDFFHPEKEVFDSLKSLENSSIYLYKKPSQQ